MVGRTSIWPLSSMILPGEIPRLPKHRSWGYSRGCSSLTPGRLTIINAIQLAVAVVANVFLLLNMARRVRFTIAQPITMAGWYISAILLIALTATASGPLMDNLKFPSSECMWSQAFYYGIWAAILYFLNASLMAVTFWGAWTAHYDKDFSLTPSQRTLMLQTIMFLMYLLLGALVFSNVENWNYLDAVYWADVTLFTVGFGDFTATTNLGRALLFPYALVGIISLGLVIASIRSMILERAGRRVNARVEEKQRRHTVRRMTLRGDDMILKPVQEEPGTSISPDQESTNPSNTPLEEMPTSEYERRRAEFELMRNIQNAAVTRRRWMAMAISTGSWLILWLVGAYIFYRCEKPFQRWTYFDAFYFCYVSFTTIGYGDVTPISPAGKSFFVFWSLLTLPTMTVLISNAGDTVVKFIRDATLQLGNITILPGELGFMGSVKHILNKLTRGHFFPEHRSSVPDLPPEFTAYISSPSDDETNPEEHPQHPFQDAAAGRGEPDERGRSTMPQPDPSHLGGGETSQARTSQLRAPSTFTSKVRRSLSRLRNPLDDLPAGTDFHFLLISEIQVVTGHLRETPSRKYSFEEWAWYLKLIGEDERDPSNHRTPKPKDHKNPSNRTPQDPTRRHHRRPSQRREFKENEKADAAEQMGKTRSNVNGNNDNDNNNKPIDDDQVKWSWVGSRSPLAGSQEESEWILDRLTNRLKESLSAERRLQMKRKPRGEGRLAKRFGYTRAPTSQASGMNEKRQSMS